MASLKRLAIALAEMCPSWLKEHDWKSCKRVSVSRVRIPTSPPLLFINQGQDILYKASLLQPAPRLHSLFITHFLQRRLS